MTVELTYFWFLAHAKEETGSGGGCQGDGSYDDTTFEWDVHVQGDQGTLVEVVLVQAAGDEVVVDAGYIGCSGELSLSGTTPFSSGDTIEVRCSGEFCWR